MDDEDSRITFKVNLAAALLQGGVWIMIMDDLPNLYIQPINVEASLASAGSMLTSAEKRHGDDAQGGDVAGHRQVPV